MSGRDDGGPAFPLVLDLDRAVSGVPTNGMSLRDWFAGQALIGLGTWTPLVGEETYLMFNVTHEEQRRRRAEWAYQQADAMLAEREKLHG